jgi:hypothetical protein
MTSKQVAATVALATAQVFRLRVVQTVDLKSLDINEFNVLLTVYHRDVIS